MVEGSPHPQIPMKTISAIILFTITLGIAVPNATADGRYPWLDDLEKGRILAKALDKPLCIVFRCEP